MAYGLGVITAASVFVATRQDSSAPPVSPAPSRPAAAPYEPFNPPITFDMVGAQSEPVPPSPPLRWNSFESPPPNAVVPGSWESPEYTLERVDEFANVPPEVARFLRIAGCRIPQRQQADQPHNLLWGEFERRGQRDLVVLCALNGRGTAFMFWAGDAERVEVLPFVNRGETLWLGDATHVDMHADPTAIVTPEMPETVDHDILTVSCCECCSQHWYKHEGRWFYAQGAD